MALTSGVVVQFGTPPSARGGLTSVGLSPHCRALSCEGSGRAQPAQFGTV
jgi:hypothetical protein